MRRASRVDGPHKAIMGALRQVGCAVADTSRVGGGFPDLVVFSDRGLLLVEVKTARGVLTPEQDRFHARFPVSIVRSVDEALELVGVTV